MSLVAELQRRRVFRAVVGYGIAAFAILQIIEPIMHGLHWPEAVLSYVVAALSIGFPAVVALAWIFDVNAGRIERTEPPAAATGLRGARLALVLVGIGVLAAAPGVAWYFFLRGRGQPRAEAPRTASIAVLPFANLSGGQENEYFSDGVTEEIINALANVEGIRVVARTSAFSFKGRNVNIRQVGEELNVASVLEGSVRREGNQLRVVAQLIGAADGYQVWSKTYDRELKGVFSLEDELARAIVQALKPKLVPAVALVQQTTLSTEAHDLYLKGRYFWNLRTKESLARAATLFEKAIALDPGYALAHSGRSDCYILSVQYGDARAADAFPKAKVHALRALELDDALAEAHASLALLSGANYEWGLADRESRRAIEIRPGYATAHQWYAIDLMSMGNLAEAQNEIELARTLDPTSETINIVLSQVLLNHREYDRAIEQALKTLDINPDFVLARIWLAVAYRQAGRYAEALAALEKITTVPIDALRVPVLAAAGDRAAAQRLLADLEKRVPAEHLRPGHLARAYLALGDKDGAFLWLERGIEERHQSVRDLKVSSDWDSIRSDPRYHKLLKRMNLE